MSEAKETSLKTKKTKYRKFPRMKDGSKDTIDRQKLRAMYLANPSYSWREFCISFNFHPSNESYQFPLKRWQSEWLEQQVNSQDDSIVNKAIEVRSSVIKERIAYVPVWNQRARNIGVLFDMITQKHHEHLAHDLANKVQIEAGTIKAKSKLTSFEAFQLALGYQTLQNIHLKALLVPQDNKQSTMIPLPEKSVEEKSEELEEENLRNMPVNVMGMSGVSPDVMVEVLGKWYDQQSLPEPMAAPEKSTAPNNSIDIVEPEEGEDG